MFNTNDNFEPLPGLELTYISLSGPNIPTNSLLMVNPKPILSFVVDYITLYKSVVFLNKVGITDSGIPSPVSVTDISTKNGLFGTDFALTLIKPDLVCLNEFVNKLTKIYVKRSGSE